MEVLEALDSIDDNIISISALSLTLFIVSRTNLLVDSIVTAATYLLGLPIYVRILVAIVQNDANAFSKFKRRQGFIAMIVLPYIVYMLFEFPSSIEQAYYNTLYYVFGFMLVYFSYQFSISYYKYMNNLADKPTFREKFFIIVPLVAGSMVTILVFLKFIVTRYTSKQEIMEFNTNNTTASKIYEYGSEKISMIGG